MIHTSYKLAEEKGIPPLVGTCLHFCSPEEAKSRKEQRRLHVLEVSTVAHVNSDKAVPVKEFIRSGAGHVTPTPSDLRPLSVLVDAITYLITSVCMRSDHPWWLVSEFVTNRLQAIRQDITYQQPTGLDVDYIFQLASRFHLYTQSRLWNCPVNKFDPKLNSDNLQQCLIKLVRYGAVPYPEFEAYHLLVNLGNTDSLQHALELSEDLRSHPSVARAMCINQCYMENNFVRWFRLVGQLSPLEQAAVLPYVNTVRRVALAVVSKAYCSKNGSIPIKTLCDWLLMSNTTQMTEMCTAHGLEVGGEMVNFRKGAFILPAAAKALGNGLEALQQMTSPLHLIIPVLCPTR